MLPIFVKNRVKEIECCEDVVISYTNTKENPADLATRGATTEDLCKNEQWWHGPSWVQQPCDTWYSSLGNDTLLESKTERQDYHECDLLNSSTRSNEPSVKELCSPFEIDIETYSPITKLFRVTALASRFIDKLRKQSSKGCHITAKELEGAEKMWLQYIQRKNFPEVHEGI